MIDAKWKDVRHEPELHVYMIDPHNLEVTRGELTGVTACTITDGYESDTKISGSITTIADNYIGGSWLRITVDGKEVATLGVSNIAAAQAPEGGEQVTYTLQSVLWMLNADLAYSLYTIGKNTKTTDVIKSICKTCGKSVVFQGSAKNSIYSAAKAYERTDSYRAILADNASKSGNQLSVDGHGRISVSAYVAPGSKAVSYVLDADAKDGIILDPGYEDTDQTGEAYNRTVVVATNNSGDKEKVITAHSDAPASSPISSSYRGWTRTQVHDVQDMSPFTQAKANSLVNTYISDDRSRGITRSATTMYFPCAGGEIVEWKQDGKTKKYQIQTVESDLEAWTSKFTLKLI